MKRGIKYIFALVLLLKLLPVYAQLRLPKLISEGMVLQRDVKIKIWGWASPGERVTVAFNKKNYKTKAAASGDWFLYLPPTKAGGPYSITITAGNTVTVNDVLFGDVWFCSGQSNMVHQMNIHDVTYAKDIAEASYPQIRQFLVPAATNLTEPQKDFPGGNWVKAIGEEVRPFSAVAYFFAKNIYDKYKIPIGIINASVGGTPIEAWASEEGLKDFSSVMQTIQKNKDTAYINETNRKAAEANKPAPSKDAGLSGETKWFDNNYIPAGWRNINIPGYWEDQGIKDLNGVVWYRKEIDIPASMTGKPAKVFLGRIVDADELYINGEKVGNTTYMYPQRRYPVPAGTLKAGKNIFTIRVTNFNNKGGFVPDKPYYIFAGNDTVDLKGTWQYKVGEVFEPKSNTISSINLLNQPAAPFNAMTAPVINYSIKGIVWYQGESNTGQAKEYAKLLPALIRDWRRQWKDSTLPFLYAQLPNFMEANYLPAESDWAELRESQRKTLSVSNTAMTVNIDLGEWNDIHPDNKKDVGERLALAARKLVYKENIVAGGPLYQSAIVEGNKIIIGFTNTGTGLITNDGKEPAEFAIAGADKKFIWAKTKIENEKVIAWNDNIPNPVYVRYAWADNPVNPNLCNKEKLPASPFEAEIKK